MEGWQCPICKKVYSPFVTSCFQCGEDNIRTSIGTDGFIVVSHCKFCDKEIMQDSQGNWF